MSEAAGGRRCELVIVMFTTYLVCLFAAAIPTAYVMILHHYFKHLD